MDYKKTSKKLLIFYCEKCKFKCSKKQDFNRHLLTAKHQNDVDDYTKTSKNSQLHICICGKRYVHRQGLYTHKKKCNELNNKNENKEIHSQKLLIMDENDISYKDMFLEMMKQNQELQKTMMEQQKNTVEQHKNTVDQQKQYTDTIKELIPKIGNNNTTNTTNNNQQFNLQMFLNEDCKNALNITDFMKSIQVNLNDLIQTGKLGYVEGMSRIFVKALKDMDITERPIHCTDIKRETVYIKDQDKWAKDDDDKMKIKKTIQNIENKNIRMISKWQDENPDCMDMESKKSEELTELSIIALGGDEERGRSEKKIMKNVLKEVMLDKK